MTTLFLRRNLILLCCSLLLFAACKKKETATPADPNAKPADIVVLRDGASFSQDITLMQDVFANSSVGIHDFSIDPANNMLHILYFTKMPGQQGYITNDIHSYHNLSTKVGETYSGEQIPTLSGMETQYEFMPYSGKLVAFHNNPFTYGAYQRAVWAGDGISQTELPWQPSGIGFGYTGGAGYNNMYTDAGWRKHYMNINPNPAASALAPVSLENREYMSPAHNEQTLVSFPDPRSGAMSPVIITVCKDSVVAYKFTYAATTTGIATQYTKTGQLTPSGYTAGITYKTQRHYSANGDKMAMMVRDDNNKKYWTYVYTHSSETLVTGLSAVDLPYSGEGSDIDMDDDGNIYYTGVSGNGGGAGVSIYKRSASGTTLVGTDDFLKFGTVSKLRYLNGKVHMIVTGSVTGTSFWKQVCYIRQQ